ncbi:hypothetical protein [Streptomyces sp. 6N223]|uniref:hypothetical protein n=1 Tax=Streptomyces sp. 6N223 TaxID=3457412 RepID=UPI003FD4D8CC
MAMAVEQADDIEESAPPPAWDDELRGLVCALCRRPLLPTWRAVQLLDVVEHNGRAYGLYACAPECSTFDDRPEVMKRILTALRAPADPQPPP